MSISRVVATVVIVWASVSGCSGPESGIEPAPGAPASNSGVPAPFTSAPEVGHGAPALASGYRDRLEPSVAADLAVYDRLRAIDPCGVIDMPSVTALAPARLLPAQPLERCVAIYDWPVPDPRAKDMFVDAEAISSVRADTPDRRETEIGGRTAWVWAAQSCRVAIPLAPLSDGSVAAVVYSRDAGPGGPDDCVLLEQIVAASVPSIESGAAPAAALREPAASMDPCAPAAALPADRALSVSLNGWPHECTIGVGDPVRRIDDIRVRIENSARGQAYDESYPLSSGRRVLFDGIPAVEDTSGGSCRYRIFVGTLRPAPQADKQVPYTMNTLDVSGRDCAAISAVASAAVAIFRGR